MTTRREEKSPSPDSETGKITLDTFLKSHQLKRPKNLPSVSLDDMEEAIGRSVVDLRT